MALSRRFLVLVVFISFSMFTEPLCSMVNMIAPLCSTQLVLPTLLVLTYFICCDTLYMCVLVTSQECIMSVMTRDPFPTLWTWRVREGRRSFCAPRCSLRSHAGGLWWCLWISATERRDNFCWWRAGRSWEFFFAFFAHQTELERRRCKTRLTRL